MKKKMFYFAALVAASAALTGCSGDEDLSAAQPAVSKGYPMYVSASAGDETRGTDLTGDNFNAFTMYSTIPTTKNDKWATGIVFSKTTSGWSAGTADVSFPDNTNTYTFYGVSDAANITNSGSGIGTVTPESFNFTYQIPTDYAAQQDLLVGKTTGSGSDGKVNFTGDNKFTHALAKIEAVKIYCNIGKVSNAGDKEAYRFRINGIRLGGLKTVGTYTFGSSWDELDGEGEFEIPLTASGLTFGYMGFQPGENSSAVTLPLADDGLYLIPQTAVGAIDNEGSGYKVTGPYAELDAQVFFYSNISTPENGGVYRVGEDLYQGFDWDEDSSNAVGFGKIRVPLKFTITEGNGYTLILDISKAVIYENEGSVDGSAVTESIFSGATIVVG